MGDTNIDSYDIPIVARPFEKVSFGQFVKDMESEYSYFKNGEHADELKSIYDDIKLPTRATFGAAGYDFYAPFGFRLGPGNTIKIPTGIRVDMDKNWWLLLCPKSGLGFKHSIRLTNTIGVDDADYYYANNEGHIFIKMEMPVNSSSKHYDENTKFGKSLRQKYYPVNIARGDKFAQGIFVPYGVTENDYNIEKDIRNGGFGSTGK